MNGNLLLYWMSRLGAGSWQRFVEALKELDAESDINGLRRGLPARLSDLGHVDFLRKSNKWKVRRPVIAGLAGSPNAAVLCGARSETLTQSFEKAARLTGCNIDVDSEEDLPRRILVRGNDDKLALLERATGVRFVSDYARQLLSTAVPVLHKLALAQPESGTLNWEVRIFDFSIPAWVPFTDRLSMASTLPRTAALELKSEYETKYCVVEKDGTLRKLPRREAVYAAASLQGHLLLEYNNRDQILSTPAAAPMPEGYTRIACLCSGRSGRWEAGRFLYERVPPAIAMTLTVLAGQQHPGFQKK
jgi:hypothetical protein